MTVETLPPPWSIASLGKKLKNETQIKALFKLITSN